MTDPDQTYEAKHARAMANIDRQLAPRITAIRLVGPIMPILSPHHVPLLKHRQGDFVIANCRFCNPPPKVYTCPACDWETEEKWRMRVHNVSNPKWCRDRAAKKARKWAQHA